MKIEAEWTTQHLPSLQKHYSNPNLPKGFPMINSFRQAIEVSSDAFIDWRYSSREKNKAFHIPDAVLIARKIIVAARPDLGMRKGRIQAI